MSVVKQIEVKETLIKDSLKKIDEIEIKLKKSNLSDDERDAAKGDLRKMKKDLMGLEKDLQVLRLENKKNMIVTTCVVIFVVIVYYFLWT